MLYYTVLGFAVNVVVKRQPQQGIAVAVGVVHAAAMVQVSIIGAGMQRLVVKHRVYIGGFKPFYGFGALSQAGKNQAEMCLMASSRKPSTPVTSRYHWP